MRFKIFLVSAITALSIGLSGCNKEPVKPAHEHVYGEWTETVAPTCTEKGKEEHVCECGAKEERDIDALGHLPKTEWEVTVQPTTETEGEEVLKCQRCEEILETRKIDKLEPEEENDGSLEHPFTVTEAHAIAATLETGKNTTVQYYIKGTVTGEVNFYKGRLSFDITDGEEVLYVYNMNNAENKASWTETQDTIAAGVEIVVAGTFKNYNGKLEICYVKDVADCYLIDIIS